MMRISKRGAQALECFDVGEGWCCGSKQPGQGKLIPFVSEGLGLIRTFVKNLLCCNFAG